MLEVYGGPRPANVDRFMAPLREQLERRGFAARPETITKLFGGRIPRPGILDKGVTTATILDLVNAGYDAFSRARFDEAASKLADAIDKIHHNSALLVLDTGNQEVVYKAHVGLALSQSRLGQADQAAATMAELIRMYRTQPLSRAEHGPTAEQFARKIYKQVAGKGRGRLRVRTGNAQTMVFVDYQIRGMGVATLEDLIPGIYHVLVQEPQTAGLAYEVEVPENGDVELDASWEIDTSLTVSSRWIGFELASDAERRKEGVYGGSLALRWSGRETFATVGTMTIQGRPALIGTLYLASGKVLRSAVIVLQDALHDADDATLGALAQFLADGTPATGLDIVVGSSAARPARPARRGAPRAAMLLTIAGGVALIGGGVLYAMDEDIPPPGQPQPRTYFDSARGGIALGAAGAAALCAGIWLWTRGGHRGAVPFAALDRSGGVLGLASSF